MKTIEQLTAARDAAKLLYENSERALTVAQEAEAAKPKSGKELLDALGTLHPNQAYCNCNETGSVIHVITNHSDAGRHLIAAEVTHRLNNYPVLEAALQKIKGDSGNWSATCAKYTLSKAARKETP